MAHSRSPARRCASTGMPWPVGLDADGFQADPVGARAAAGGDEQPVAAQLAAVVERQHVVRRRRGARRSPARRGRARRRRGAGPRRAPRPAARARGPARARRPRPGPPRRPGARTAWAISAPTGPPPRMSRRRGTAFMPVTSRLVHTPSSSRRPGTGGTTGSEPVASDDVPGGVAHAVDLDHAGPGEPPGAAEQVDALARQPALLAGVGVVRDHEVAPGQRRLRRRPPRWPPASRAPCTASPGRSSVLDGMHAQ